jgi:tRNA-Thr(GGU) m(6)t(6)A37 methyltransferase TsaA
MSEEIVLNPIGIVHSCYQEKFGTPRQPGLVEHSNGKIEIYPDFAPVQAFKGLEQFSHLWVLFHFNQSAAQGWNPTVRPPRLGGNKHVGVFASRSMFRPNPVGLSVVKLERIEHDGQRCYLHISGQDIIDKTPVIDIKPYIPYVDAIPDATGGYAESKPLPIYKVIFTQEAELILMSLGDPFKQLIMEVLSYDPRPQYHEGKNEDRIYGFKLSGYNVRWKVMNENLIEVTAVDAIKKGL